MFEGMGASVYLIDANTNVIEYMNENAVQNSGEFIVGKKCYKTLQNSECRCEDCPLAKMDIDDSKANQRKDAFNYSTNRWSANLYSWVSGRDNKGKALLLSIDMDDVFSMLDSSID